MNKNEKGFALVLSLVLLLVMSLMGGSLIVIASGDHSNNNTSDKYQQVFYVAETGLMQGEKWVANNYLGHWMGAGDVPSAAEVLTAPGEDATAAETAAYDASLTEYGTYTEGYAAYANGLIRHSYERGPAKNEISVKSENKTECMNSFKNIEILKDLKVAGEDYIQYIEGGVKFNFSNNRQHSFLTLIQPILDANSHFMESDDDFGFSEDEVDTIIKDEESYLEKFKYEYFVINVGTASYRGTGSSVAKTSSSALDSSGSAYKVYACGMYYNNTADAKPDIIVPLESLIILPG